ncbi:MAG: tetratricopeptide repeat protein [Kiritimatiellia bacterium]
MADCFRRLHTLRSARPAADPAILVVLAAAPLLHAAEAPDDPQWRQAADLYGKRHWADAEKAFLAYARRFPAPPRRADALVGAGACSLMLHDAPAARRHFEKAAYDEDARRKSPKAVAEAFDRLHALLLEEGASAARRARVLDDCRRRLPDCAALPRMQEREGDALLAAGLHRQAADRYVSAGAGLSPGGTNTLRLLRGCFSVSPPPLDGADAARLAEAVRAKPACSAALCGLLSGRREGWLAEDVRARHLLDSGKASEAAAAWEAMLRRRRGPPDRIAFARCEALAAWKPGKGIEALEEWLERYKDSPLRERAAACHALLPARHGDPAEAASRLGAFLGEYPGSRFAPEARQALARARGASDRLEQLRAAQAAKEERRRRDPASADLERAESLLSQGRHADAEKAFLSFRDRRRHPLWGRAWHGLGKARHARGDTQGALAAWDDLWRRSLADTNVLCAARARRAAGDAWLEDLGEPARALKAYDEAASRTDFSDPAFDLNRGLALLMLGRAPEAAAVFTRRRDASAGDKAEFLRWDRLAKECAAGRLAPPPRGLLPDQRRARTDLAMADALLAAGEPARALRLYRRASAPLAGHEGADRCDLGMALALAALGRPKEALALYGRFTGEHGRSPLAAGALLRAGTLCALPRVNDFKGACQWFARVVENHPGTREAEAAEFYAATLAWRGRKWAEAEKLHKAFAANHPGSPLARVALDERLPAIARKSLEVPTGGGIDRTNTVYVAPGSRKRSAFPIVKEGVYNACLDIRSERAFKESHVEDVDPRDGTALWTGPTVKSPSWHRYHLSDAYSSQEYVMVRGTFAEPSGRGGGAGGGLPPFRVTVPSVDVDWAGFAGPADENGEEARFVVVPLNTNKADDIRGIKLHDPFDDDQRNDRPRFPHGKPVHPDITLHWEAGNPLALLGGTTVYTDKIEIDAGEVDWPLDYAVIPRHSAISFAIAAEGQAAEGGKAVDIVHGRIVDVDIDVDANYDGKIDDADEPLEVDPGGYVCVGTNNLTPVTLKLEPVGLPGKLTLSATMGGDRIRIWKDAGRAVEVVLTNGCAQVAPGTLYVEGVTNSAALRDVELRIEYDENPQGQDNPPLQVRGQGAADGREGGSGCGCEQRRRNQRRRRSAGRGSRRTGLRLHEPPGTGQAGTQARRSDRQTDPLGDDGRGPNPRLAGRRAHDRSATDHRRRLERRRGGSRHALRRGGHQQRRPPRRGAAPRVRREPAGPEQPPLQVRGQGAADGTLCRFGCNRS